MIDRRKFLSSSLKGLGLLCGGGFLVSLALEKKNRFYLRPPGGEDEDRFLSLCIRCGLCVDACPYDTLKLASLSDLAANGTPFFEPRNIPCYLCDDIPCIDKCPTNALDDKYLKKPKGVFETKMGVAIIDTATCVAYWGLRCDACYRACPLIDKALKIEYKHNDRTNKHAYILPVVDNEICVGCGKCERACITEKASITVLPRDFALGKAGGHYTKGWDEKSIEELENPASKNFKGQNQGVLDYLNDGEL